MFHGIDLVSDTATRPTPGMRQAMFQAEVGDEQRGEDPTTLRLEKQMAELLGFSSALFFPSATLANEIAILLHCNRGDELIAYEDCHLFVAESGGPAFHAGVMVKPIHTANGIFSGDDVRAAYRSAKGPLFPVSRLVSVENTTNMGGGVPWELSQLKSVLDAAKELSLKTHMDGARLFNAVVKTGRSAKEIVAGFDTVTVCLSKGLGCPTGAILAFDRERWAEVRMWKQRMGGAMRQSGMLAAAGLYALENNIPRLAEDHLHAELFASGISQVSVIHVENPKPQTNMIFFQWKSRKSSCQEFLQRCIDRGVRFSEVGPNRMRAVTHLEITRADIEKAVSIVQEAARSLG